MSKLQLCISALFDPDDREAVNSMLGELPDDTRQDALRIQLAAVRYSGGSLQRLRSAIAVCRRDFRDLLMNAGFGEDINEHLSWVPRPFHKHDLVNWLNGERIRGVEFRPNEDAWKLTAIQRIKKDAKVISLVGLEPTVVYLVRYLSGKEEQVPQTYLVKQNAG